MIKKRVVSIYSMVIFIFACLKASSQTCEVLNPYIDNIYSTNEIYKLDMMRENGMAPYEYNLLAEAWGDPKSIIPGWDIVTDGTLEAGDVAAYKAKYTNATGHMGIVTYHNDRFQLVYAGTSDKKRYIAATSMTWWKKNFDNIVVRRYVGINK